MVKIRSINKKIKWVISRLFSLIAEVILNCFIKKDEKLWLFGCKMSLSNNKEYFINNTKYLYLYLNELNDPDIHFVWLCDDNEMIKQFHQYGLRNVYKRKSLKGIWSILKAKYWFCDTTANQTSRFNGIFSKAKVVNFWHGASGIKKCNLDSKSIGFNKNSIQYYIYNLLKCKEDYFTVNSKYEGQCRKSAFEITDDKLVYLSSPRLDILYKDISNAEIFMEKDFNTIKKLKDSGKKIFIYMPTFRDTGKDISSWVESDNLKNVLKEHNAIMVCKLHPSDVNSIKSASDEIYVMDNSSDIYPVLKYSNGLITDYSSVYMDYLHLDKPIIHHIPDLKEYETQCRGFYRPFNTLVAGKITTANDEIINAIVEILENCDNYKDLRKKMLDEMFIFQDENNCKRIVEFIKGLNASAIKEKNEN